MLTDQSFSSKLSEGREGHIKSPVDRHQLLLHVISFSGDQIDEKYFDLLGTTLLISKASGYLDI